MRILVIGGNGFIGKPLLSQLHDAGHQLAVFHRKRSDNLPNAIQQIVGDRREIPRYRDEIRKLAPEVIIDLILSSAKQADQLLETVSEIRPRIIAISSMDVYRACGVLKGTEDGPLEPLPLTEESPLRGTSEIYPAQQLEMLKSIFGWLDDAYDKLAVERQILSMPEMPATILRLPMLYGPGDHMRRFYPVVRRIEDRRRAILFAQDVAAWRSPRGYVDNVAAAIALVTTSTDAVGKIFNVCEQQSFSELEWAKKIAIEMNWQGRFVVLPRKVTPTHLLIPGNLKQHWVASSERIRREVGYSEIISTDQAICRTIEWELSVPPPQIHSSTLDYAAEDIALSDSDSELSDSKM